MAADALAVAPARSVVIEDSVNGVLAAKRAGMHVIGFTGGAHCAADHAIELAQSGADWTFGHFNQVTSFLLDQQ